jgi:hypothetical protein
MSTFDYKPYLDFSKINFFEELRKGYNNLFFFFNFFQFFLQKYNVDFSNDKLSPIILHLLIKFLFVFFVYKPFFNNLTNFIK